MFSISLLMTAVLFTLGAYQRYDNHAKLISTAQHAVNRYDEFYMRLETHLANHTVPDTDAFYHAVRNMQGVTSFADLAAITTMIVNIKHTEREISKLDRDVNEYHQILRDLYAGGQLEKRMVGDFESYYRSSDKLKDVLIGVEGTFKASQSNPDLVHNEGDPLGKHLSKSIESYGHSLNLIFDTERAGVDWFKDGRDKQLKTLHGLQAKAFWV